MSKGTIKPANQKFTSIKNHYAITFGPYSFIKEVKDHGDIKSQAFAFTKLEDVEKFV